MNGKNNFKPNKINIKDFKKINDDKPTKFVGADCILLYTENEINRILNNYSNISNDKYREILENHNITLEGNSESSR